MTTFWDGGQVWDAGNSWADEGPSLSDLDRFVAQLIQLLPRAWFSNDAIAPGGVLYNLLVAIAQQFVALQGQLDYVALQSRIATATDSNLDAIGRDLFGTLNPAGTLHASQRALEFLTPTIVIPESDAHFSARIRQDVIMPHNTIAGIQAHVQEYIDNFYAPELFVSSHLGLNTSGGLDTVGGLDGQNPSNLIIPKVTVFDIQSNPKLAAQVPLTASQFCVLFSYGGVSKDGFILGHSYLGHKSFLLNPSIRVIDPLTPILDDIVEEAKAQGTKQIYCDDRIV